MLFFDRKKRKKILPSSSRARAHHGEVKHIEPRPPPPMNISSRPLWLNVISVDKNLQTYEQEIATLTSIYVPRLPSGYGVGLNPTLGGNVFEKYIDYGQACPNLL